MIDEIGPSCGTIPAITRYPSFIAAHGRRTFGHFSGSDTPDLNIGKDGAVPADTGDVILLTPSLA